MQTHDSNNNVQRYTIPSTIISFTNLNQIIFLSNVNDQVHLTKFFVLFMNVIKHEKYMKTSQKWNPPNLSELTPVIFHR